MNPEWTAIGQRLRTAREYLGFSQDQVATYLGIHRPSVSEIEAGRRKVDALELSRLAKLYSKPVAYFTGEAEAEMGQATAELLAGASGLPDEDRAELAKFAEFLHWRKRAKEG